MHNGTHNLVTGGGAAIAPGHVPISSYAEVVPAPQPSRIHWATIVCALGTVLLFVAILFTVAGVPASMGYDIDGAPKRNKPTSNDPLKLSQSLDGNMKWIAESSGDGEQQYVGLIKSVNRSEGAIAPMVQAVLAMDASVKSIDSGIADVYTVTQAMQEDMAAMAGISATSSGRMETLNGDIDYLSQAMVDLAASTQELTDRMNAINGKASDIAANGTGSALKLTEELNSTLPAEVPKPIFEEVAQ